MRNRKQSRIRSRWTKKSDICKNLPPPAPPKYKVESVFGSCLLKYETNRTPRTWRCLFNIVLGGRGGDTDVRCHHHRCSIFSSIYCLMQLQRPSFCAQCTAIDIACNVERRLLMSRCYRVRTSAQTSKLCDANMRHQSAHPTQLT